MNNLKNLNKTWIIILFSLLITSCYATSIDKDNKTIYSFNNTICGYKKHNIIYADNVEKMNTGFQHLKDFSQPTAILFDLTKIQYPLQNEFFNKNINDEIPFDLSLTTCF